MKTAGPRVASSPPLVDEHAEPPRPLSDCQHQDIEGFKILKLCRDCQEYKPLDDFYYARESADRLQSYCKVCSGSRARKAHLKREYGITEGQYDQLTMVQCGLCAICSQPEMMTHKSKYQPPRLSVHHDHSTGKIVALLCRKCNEGMGCLRDDKELLRRAAAL